VSCDHLAANTYQDYRISYDAAREETVVDATVREVWLNSEGRRLGGTAILMTDGCTLEFEAGSLAKTDRQDAGIHYIGEYDGFHGDGAIFFTDIDGHTYENSIDVAPDSFGLSGPSIPSVSGFDMEIIAPLEATHVVFTVVKDDGPRSGVVQEGVSGTVTVDGNYLSRFAAGDEVEIFIEIRVDRSITEPPDGSGRIVYQHKFEPIPVTLAE